MQDISKKYTIKKILLFFYLTNCLFSKSNTTTIPLNKQFNDNSEKLLFNKYSAEIDTDADEEPETFFVASACKEWKVQYEFNRIIERRNKKMGTRKLVLCSKTTGRIYKL